MEDVFVIEIEEDTERKTPTHAQIQQLFDLLSQLLSDVPAVQDIWNTIRSDSSILLGAVYVEHHEDHTIAGILVGTATLILFPTPHGRVGYVHDVVVDDEIQSRGIGRKLMNRVLEIAKEEKLVEINLTTNKKKRPDAEKIYLSLGFEEKDTNFFVMKL